MELVTGFTGEPHITPEQDADLYRGVIGIDSYVLPVGRQLEHEVETVNKIVVNDGVLMLQGREMSIEAGHQDEYTIENGIQGENRIDLIGIRYTVDQDTGKESVSHETIKGESVAGNPTDPTFTTGDIRGEGAIDVFFPLYSVRLTGLTISAVVKRFAVTQSVTDLEEYIDTQKGRIDTLNASLNKVPNVKDVLTIADVTAVGATTLTNPITDFKMIEITMQYGSTNWISSRLYRASLLASRPQTADGISTASMSYYYRAIFSGNTISVSELSPNTQLLIRGYK